MWLDWKRKQKIIGLYVKIEWSEKKEKMRLIEYDMIISDYNISDERHKIKNIWLQKRNKWKKNNNKIGTEIAVNRIISPSNESEWEWSHFAIKSAKIITVFLVSRCKIFHRWWECVICTSLYICIGYQNSSIEYHKFTTPQCDRRK